MKTVSHIVLILLGIFGCFAVVHLVPKAGSVAATNTWESKLLSIFPRSHGNIVQLLKMGLQNELRKHLVPQTSMSVLPRNLRDRHSGDNESRKKKNAHRPSLFGFKGKGMNAGYEQAQGLSSDANQYSSLLSEQKASGLSEGNEGLTSLSQHSQGISSKYAAASEDRVYSRSQSDSAPKYQGSGEEERIEEILMTQKDSNRPPADSFLTSLNNVGANNDYAAEAVETVRVKGEEYIPNDSFEEDEYREEDDEDGSSSDSGSGGSNTAGRQGRTFTASHASYSIRLQTAADANRDGNGTDNNNNVEKTYGFTLFSKYSGVSTCHIYGDNDLPLVSRRVRHVSQTDLTEGISVRMAIPLPTSMDKVQQQQQQTQTQTQTQTQAKPSYIQCEIISADKKKITTPRVPLQSFTASLPTTSSRNALRLVIILLGVAMVALLAYYTLFHRALSRKRATTEPDTPNSVDVEQTCSLINEPNASFSSLGVQGVQGVQRRVLSRPDLSSLSHASGIFSSVDGMSSMNSVGSLVNLRDDVGIQGKRRSRRIHGGPSVRSSYVSEGGDPMECQSCGMTNPPSSVVCRTCGSDLI